MLQQTQVKTVLPYWHRWMKALPTIGAVARARPARIRKLWEGLGYYSRARNLQNAARVILADFGGKFPSDFDAVLALPGVGRYTAGAICSIAFDHPQPILDGNVIRVLARVFGIRGNPREKPANARLWDLSQQLVSEASLNRRTRRPCSDLNQALMELGALVCSPRQPNCNECPLSIVCWARLHGRTEQLPELPPQNRMTARRFVAFVSEHGGRLLLSQRAKDGVNALFWEFPNQEIHHARQDPAVIAAGLLGVRPASLRPLGKIKHSITRYRITVEFFQVLTDTPHAPESSSQRWVSQPQASRLALTAAHRKALERLVVPVMRAR